LRNARSDAARSSGSQSPARGEEALFTAVQVFVCDFNVTRGIAAMVFADYRAGETRVDIAETP
jgi:hypothetical protein